jgi:hypothetical protein
MGRFSWIRTAVIGAVMAWSGGTASALENTSYDEPLGSCFRNINVHTFDLAGGSAMVELIDFSVGGFGYRQRAGGMYWRSGEMTSSDSITKEQIAYCLGTDTGNITNLTQKGAEGTTSILQTYMGFSFTLSDTAVTNDENYVAGVTYPFYVGTPPNNTPTANAGPDQTAVASAAAVTLDGTDSSDPDAGDTLSYTWAQTDSTGTTVTLSGASADKPTFTAPTLNIGDAATTLVFSLTVNDGTVDSPADTVSITVVAPSAAPTALVATAGDSQVSIAFTAPSTDGGATIDDYEYELDDSGAWLEASTTSSPVVITGLTNGTSYSIKLRAVNSAGDGAESAAVSVILGSPASAFEEAEAEVQAIITQDATRSLNSTLSSNQRMTRGARSRFIDSRSQGEGNGAGLATRNNVPFDVDGTFDLDGARLSTKVTFFGQTGNVEGTERRLVFGEFDVQRDGDTGSTTATLTGRVAWEQMISDDTMLGYFVGGELADSNISGAFEGSQKRVAATAGGYAVRALSETLFADGFISIGAGRNNLAMADDVLALTSDYTTRTATVGGALTGVYAYERYELRPELAFSYGKTWIGDVGFTGVAYGLTDDALSLDAGNVSIANLTLRPEIVWALDAETVADSNAQLSFAPRFICQRTSAAATTQNCGAGAEIGLSSNSEDGLSSANIRFVMDRVGNSNRSNVLFNVEHKF